MAFEGTGLSEGDGVTQAEDAQGFASAIVRLHKNEAAWTKLSGRAVERCKSLYAPDAALAIYRTMLTSLGLPFREGQSFRPA
jgi:hypothetical protein